MRTKRLSEIELDVWLRSEGLVAAQVYPPVSNEVYLPGLATLKRAFTALFGGRARGTRPSGEVLHLGAAKTDHSAERAA